MKLVLVLFFTIFAILPISILAQDPADSWLVYGVAKGGGKRVTWVNATWVVPSFPSNQGMSEIVTKYPRKSNDSLFKLVETLLDGGLESSLLQH